LIIAFVPNFNSESISSVWKIILIISNSAYFTAYYNRLVIENHKDPNVAIFATAHKLLKCIIKIIHSGEAFATPTIFEPEFAQIKIPRD